MTPGDAFALIAVLALLAAAVFDLVRFEIPDILSVVIFVAALAYGALTPGFGWASHLAAPLLMLGVGLLLLHFGMMGGGDIKLFIAIAGWTGLAGLASQIVSVILVGGALALLLLLARVPLAGRGLAAPALLRKGAPVPYAVAIAAGTLLWAAREWPTS